MKKYKTISIISLFLPLLTFAANQEYVPISGESSLKSLGLTQSSFNDLSSLLGTIYSFGIAVAVVVSVISLIIAGIQKMTTESYTGKSDAKQRIINAFQGLGLALASYLILYLINPCLVDFTGSKDCKNANTLLFPSKIISVPGTTEYTTSGNYQTTGDIDVGSYCSNCVNGSTYGLECKDGCQMNESLAAKLQNILSEHNAWITEGYPPVVNHLDQCHNVGTCVDINFKDRSADIERVKKLYNALTATGLHVVYESANCKPYQDVGVNCKLYPTTTYTSFHAEL